MLRRLPSSTPLVVAVVSAAAIFAGGCSTISPETGPTVGVRNDSDTPLRATFWIGDRQEQRPGLPADMKAQDTLEIPPYGTKQFRLRAFSGFESTTESFVRVQVEPVGPSFQAKTQYWYELNPPSPYTIRVHGLKPNLAFERVGGGTMVMVPSNLWFRNGTGATATTSATTTAMPAQRLNGPHSPPAARAKNKSGGQPTSVSGVNER